MLETYVIHVTKQCNMNCKYCYETDKTSIYTWEEIKEFIDKLIKYRTQDSFHIEFLGGEPMLAFDLIKKSVDYFNSAKSINVEGFTITTNGTILNEEIISFLSQNKNITWACSMDGTKFMNILRVFKTDNKNSYDVVCGNIKSLQDYGLAKRISVHMVTHPYNVGYLAMGIDHIYNKLKVKSIGIGTIESTITIDEQYITRFIKEMGIISAKIHNGEYPGLYIDILDSLKPKSDTRYYIKDSSGKVIGESYGRSGTDVTSHSDENMKSIATSSNLGDTIYNMREKVYLNHHKNK